MKNRMWKVLASLAACAGLASPAAADVVLSGGGLALMEQGGTFAVDNRAATVAGAIPFSSSDLGPELAIPFHVAGNLNDGTYGNANSWIGGTANPFPAPFAGVSLDGSFTLQSIAFGRSNVTSGDPCGGGVCTDRNLGLYTLQYTTVPAPGAATPDASWSTIGTLDYQSAGGAFTNFSQPWRRHRYNFSPVANVTGVRLLVPLTGLAGGTAIDEIELYEMAGPFVPPPPPPPTVVLTPSPGFGIGFNGNNGPSIPDNPAPVPNNLALASNGGVPFSSSDLGPLLGIPFHVAANLNDGQYGNAFSWIGGDAPGPFAGVSLDGLFNVTSIAWGRDNGNIAGDCCGGTLTDRALGAYTIQFTQLAGAGSATPDTGDPATGWATIGIVDLQRADPGVFDPHLRHEFRIQTADGEPIVASAFRLLVPSTGLNGGTAIDEIEIYGAAVPEPSTWALATIAALGLGCVARRRRSA